MTKILISKKFEKEIVLESSALAWIQHFCSIQIRIRNKSIRIHNPGENKQKISLSIQQMG
jgi:hypothetical protein